MPARKIHSVNKALTDEERVRHRVIREQVEQEKAELIARGRRAKARHTMLREAIAALKTTREALGLSLADIKAATGIEKSNLSRLENDPMANPTIDTLCRYADAVGKEIVITLVDISNENR
jgi:DNA-binding Xre family transcriptional regulator